MDVVCMLRLFVLVWREREEEELLDSDFSELK
jgi:hypothetical protein